MNRSDRPRGAGASSHSMVGKSENPRPRTPCSARGRAEHSGGAIVGKKQSGGAVLVADRADTARDAHLHALGEFGVEWGFENASRFSLIFIKDLQGRIATACRQGAPLTGDRLNGLFPGIPPREVQTMQRKVAQCAARMSAPDSEAVCGRQLLQSVFVGMQKFWNEIERDMESA